MSRIAGIEAWLAVPGEWVESPNERRGGRSGVKLIRGEAGGLLYRKQQIGHVYRSLIKPLGYPTVMRERDALAHCLQLGVLVPRVVFADCRRWEGTWQAVLVTEALEGFQSLEDCYRQQREREWGAALHKAILEEVGRMLGRLNLGRRQHGCLYLKHVFVQLDGAGIRVALIDLEKSRIRLTRRQAANHDLRQIARRSGWRGEQWNAFLEGYLQSFPGTLPKGLVTG